MIVLVILAVAIIGGIIYTVSFAGSNTYRTVVGYDRNSGILVLSNGSIYEYLYKDQWGFSSGVLKWHNEDSRVDYYCVTVSKYSSSFSVYKASGGTTSDKFNNGEQVVFNWKGNCYL